MTRSTRRFIFFAFILIFLIVTPGVLLYATGYSFDWGNKQLIKTGSFYFQSQPDGAQIMIDGIASDATPGYIAHLNPGIYKIEISKDGFSTWQKKLVIQEQLATEARNIFLIPQKPEVEFIADNVTSTKEYFLTDEQKNAQIQVNSIASSTLKDILVFTIYQNNIYYLQRSNLILYRTDLSGASKEQISLQSLPLPNNVYQITISPDQIGVFEPGGNFFILDKGKKVFNQIVDEVQGIQFSSDNEKVLFWTEHEIWVIWLKEVWAQPYRKAGDKELITRYGEKIIQAVWLDKTSEHIIFSVQGNDGQDSIKLTELDSRDQRNTFDTYSAKNPEIYWNDDNDLLYILTESKLYSINLLAG